MGGGGGGLVERERGRRDTKKAGNQKGGYGRRPPSCPLTPPYPFPQVCWRRRASAAKVTPCGRPSTSLCTATSRWPLPGAWVRPTTATPAARSCKRPSSPTGRLARPRSFCAGTTRTSSTSWSSPLLARPRSLASACAAWLPASSSASCSTPRRSLRRRWVGAGEGGVCAMCVRCG